MRLSGSRFCAALRKGEFDVLVGNQACLREGLDLPEVSLVAILDADKEGYLRKRDQPHSNGGYARPGISTGK